MEARTYCPTAPVESWEADVENSQKLVRLTRAVLFSLHMCYGHHTHDHIHTHIIPIPLHTHKNNTSAQPPGIPVLTVLPHEG